jgi:putative membrane protein
MNIAQTIPLADSWGMHGGGSGWWIVGVPFMLLMMGGMMWMMMRGMGGGSSQESPAPSESPVEVLERRFAEGAISIEEYQARREALVNGSSGPNGARKDEPLIGARAGEGTQ